MQRLRAAYYGAGIAVLARTAAAIHAANAFGAAKDDSADRMAVREALNEAALPLAELPLSRVIQSQFERLKRSVDHADGAELVILVREFCNNLMVELSSAWFLMISAEEREFYEQREPAFGAAVASAFAKASDDVSAASRCFALEEWTACVFHLMRVLEHGLRALAATVGLPTEAMRHENWKNIIDQIERKIREMESLPKSPEKVSKIQFLSEAAIQFRYFKDSWRNHVSHAHASYDRHSGYPVWLHVKAFMQHMAQANPVT